MKKGKKNKSTRNKGFSLIELSVVITAIAVVISLIYGGIELLNKARINNILEDINRFTKATENFQSTYNSLPGDIADPSIVNNLSSADGGNGNGIIDGNETIKFWQHLSSTEWLEGNYDGSSSLSPSIGLPAGEIKNSGYKIIDSTSESSLPDGALIFEFSGFSSVSADLGIIRPEDAKIIDQKADDGKPNSGSIRALGSGSGGNCVSSNDYNTTNKTSSCRLRFIVNALTKINISDIVNPSATRECFEIGSTRENPDINQNCPSGFIGKIMETCRVANDGNALWEITQNICEPVKCLGNKIYNETRTLPCINGQIGSGVKQTCSEHGLWVETSRDCSTTSGIDAPTCGLEGIARFPQACGWAETGRVFQTCNSNGNWQTDTGGNSCNTISCSGGVFGDTRSGTISCGTDYLGTVVESCSIDGTWKVTFNSCKPQYSGGLPCTENSTRNIGCPPGEEGEMLLKCLATGGSSSSTYWTVENDTCNPITCDNETIGTVRALGSISCTNSTEGTILEFCDSDGQWKLTEINCTDAPSNFCPGNSDTDGFANWPSSTAPSSSVEATNCITGYEEGTGLPSRNCNSDGSWENVSGTCEPITCEAITEDNANWPETENITNSSILVNGTCIVGYSGSPVRDCQDDGTWGTISNSCTPDSP